MYEVTFAKLSERFFKGSTWPPVEMVADLVDKDHVFCLLYKVRCGCADGGGQMHSTVSDRVLGTPQQPLSACPRVRTGRRGMQQCGAWAALKQRGPKSLLSRLLWIV